MIKALKVLLVLMLVPLIAGCSAGAEKPPTLSPANPQKPAIPQQSLNGAPAIQALENLDVTEGDLVEFQVTASDPDGDFLTFSAANLPEDASFDSVAGEFSWTALAGAFPDITFTVTDGELSASASMSIRAAAVNHAPELEEIGDRELSEGSLLEIQIAATDADGDTVTYTAANLPPGAVFDAQTGRFTWTAGAAGAYPDITFTASDGTLSDTESVTFSVIVAEAENPPLLKKIGSKRVRTGATLKFKVVATDPDGDAITYSATNLPPGATLDPVTGQFIWEADKAGTYSGICIQASDGKLCDEERITITVTRPDKDSPPPT